MSASAPTPGLALTGTTTTQPPCPIHVRRALFSEQSTIARVCGAAFWDDVLFGKLIHPLREQYPRDSDLYWLRRIQTDWWDWSHVFLVTTSVDTRTGREVVSGQAHWSRIGTREQNWMAGWGLRWWDPRNLVQPIFRLYTRLLDFLRPNRAADPQQESIIERSYHYLDHIWTGPRAECWYLESLAVHPDYQGSGLGRALVRWGLQQAKAEGVACSVISADGKETFYRRCGFDVGPVGRSGEGEGNPLYHVPGGLIFFRDKDGVKVPERDPAEWEYLG